MRHALAEQAEAGAIEVADAAGDYVTDVHGNRYLDFAMGWCVGNLGWKHPEIEAALHAFDGPTYVHPGYHYRPAEELAERLLSFAPGKLCKVFRATGGTEAVELALQAAMLVTRRHGLLSLDGAYHGNSIGTLSIGSSDLRERAHAGLPRCHKIAGPFDARAAERAEVLLKKRGSRLCPRMRSPARSGPHGFAVTRREPWRSSPTFAALAGAAIALTVGAIAVNRMLT